MKKTLKIATRQSPLALCQAQQVKQKLEQHHPELMITLVPMTTKGDKLLNSPLAKIGGKGLFIKELELSMLSGQTDIAVHSIKDLPYQLPKNFALGAILARENPFDAFVSNNFNCIDALPENSKIGTCSQRRKVQLKALRADLQIVDLRGNINTRLKKLDDGGYDAIILACAGLIRLGLKNRIKQQLSSDICLPAVGQGALGIEILRNDDEILSLIKPLRCLKTTQSVLAERALNAKLEGGCTAPIGGFATIDKGKMTLTGLVGNIQTNKILKQQISSNTSNPEALGAKLAEKLLSLGAKEYLG